MTAISIILGIMMVICGVSCIFTPLITFMSTGYFIIIMICAYGVLGIIKSISAKSFGVGFVFSILSVILGVAMLFFPNLILITDGMMLYITAAWFLLMGIMTIISAFRVKKAFVSKMWIWMLIFGILAVLVGCYAFFHPIYMAVSLGVLIGIFFIETGFTMMFSATSR